MTLDLDELEALEAVATPGPWYADNAVAEADSLQAGRAYDIITAELTMVADFVAVDSDAQFVTALRNSAPELIEEIKGLRWQVSNWERKEANRGTDCFHHSEDLEKELIELRGALLRYRDEIDETWDRDKRIARLRAILKRLEWVEHISDTDIYWRCPECSRPKTAGHHSECELAAALKE